MATNQKPETSNQKPMIPLPLPQADLLFAPAFLPPAEATALLAQLTAEAAWEQRSIRLFGREFPQPRLTAWYGDPDARYTYSGLAWEPRPWLPALARSCASASKPPPAPATTACC